MQTKVWTISTVLSLSRIVFAFAIAKLLWVDLPAHRWWVVLLMAVAVATDFLDGYLARRLHQVTDFGKIVDPVADKVGVAVVGLVLAIQGTIPVWFLVVVVARDILILTGGWYIKRTKDVVPQSNWPGKISVTLIALTLFLTVVSTEASERLLSFSLWGSVAFMALSVGVYAERLFVGRRRPEGA